MGTCKSACSSCLSNIQKDFRDMGGGGAVQRAEHNLCREKETRKF
jgi:hypothetical protein